MDLHELQYFLAIADQGNITRAAELLYVSQPTLTKYLQRLEAEIGTPLFQRTGRQLTLTCAGRRYCARARELLRIKEELDAEIREIRRESVGELKVGLPPLRCSFALPQVLPAFRQLHPGVRVDVLEDNSEALDAALCAGRIDLAFYNLSIPVPGLEYRVLQHDALYAVLAPGHPAGARARSGPDGPCLALEDLAGETLLLQARPQRQGQYLYEMMKRHKFSPTRVMETSNIRAAASLAAAGYGVAFVSGGLLRRLTDLPPCDRYRLEGGPPLDYAAAWRAGTRLPGYAEDFITLMERL